jgi:flagellar assembly protein FliH
MARVPTVIKAHETDQAADQVGRLGMRAFQLNDVLHEAKQMVVSARQEAAGLVEQARRQANSIRQTARKEGHEAGFAEGHKAGHQAGRKEAFEASRREFAEQQASLIAMFGQVIDEINAKRADWWAAARQDLIELAIAIARRVVRCVGEREREVVAATLKEAVELAGKRSQITIQVHPKDAETARAFAEEMMSRQEGWKQVPVVESAEIQPGGCRIHWTGGAVDAELETQIDRIGKELGGQ